MQQETELNYEGIFGYLRKYCDDESLIWGVIAEIYLELDKTLDVPQQASYMKTRCIGLLKNEWKRQKKYVVMSRLTTEQATAQTDKITEFIDTIEYQHFQTADSDREIILKTLEHTPAELRKSVALVMNGIFENQVGRVSLTVDAIRHFLHNVGYHKEGSTLIEVARDVRAVIVNTWGGVL